MLLSRARIYFSFKSGEGGDEEGEDARRFIPGYLAPVPAHLLDCPACSNIRGANRPDSLPAPLFVVYMYVRLKLVVAFCLADADLGYSRIQILFMGQKIEILHWKNAFFC
jgi:hypothetical protein